MESTVCKTDFSYFVRMALENQIPWKSLAMILKDLTPTLIETRGVICILLKELEALQSTLKEKDKELKMYQNVGASVDNQNLTLKTKAIRENMKQNSTAEKETIEAEIELLEVVKEGIDKEMYLDMNKSSKYVNAHIEHDLVDADESICEIDTEWHTFVKNAKTSHSDAPVPEKEFTIVKLQF